MATIQINLDDVDFTGATCITINENRVVGVITPTMEKKYVPFSRDYHLSETITPGAVGTRNCYTEAQIREFRSEYDIYAPFLEAMALMSVVAVMGFVIWCFFKIFGGMK